MRKINQIKYMDSVNLFAKKEKELDMFCMEIGMEFDIEKLFHGNW